MKPMIDPAMRGVHWVATSKEPAFTPARTSDRSDFDLAVVGAGYCGLSIALTAAETGMSVVVLEAGTVGCGASGRNGGFVVPHFPGAITPTRIEARLGTARTERLAALVSNGPARVFDRISELNIQCDPERTGWVQPAHDEKSLAKVKHVHDDWVGRGADITWLDAAALRDRLGDCSYLGGWFAPTGGMVNPWALAQGLARAAEHAGAVIRERFAVSALRSNGPSKVLSAGAETVSARKVIFTTNGYTANPTPGLQTTVIPIRLFHVFTRPLTEGERARILPMRTPFTDLRRSGGFCRYDIENRVISGGAVFSAGDPVGYGKRHAARRLAELFPMLAGIEIDHYWEGWCALRESFVPVFQGHEADVFSLLGFSTRGVAMAQTLGHDVGLFLSGDIPESELPIPLSAPDPIRFQPLKRYLGGLAFPVYQMRDRVGI